MDIVVKQTGQAGCWLTVDIQTRFHSFLLLLVHLKLESKWTQGLEVAPIQSPNCADWHSKHLRVRISGCPPPGVGSFYNQANFRSVTEPSSTPPKLMYRAYSVGHSRCNRGYLLARLQRAHLAARFEREDRMMIARMRITGPQRSDRSTLRI